MFLVRRSIAQNVSRRFFSTEAEATISLEPQVVKLPYKVTRTASNKLPVYTEIINGGQTVTLVRRIEGNERALALELRRLLGDKINITTRDSKKVVVAGNQRLRIEQFLKDLGF